MKKALIILLAFGLTLPGCRMMLYPLARSFGGWKQSDIKANRAAFTTFKKDIRSSRLVAFPAMVVREGEASWDEEAAWWLVEELKSLRGFHAEAAAREPGIGYQPMKRNQLRHRVEMARAYAGWIKTQPRTGDYYLLTEIHMSCAG